MKKSILLVLLLLFSCMSDDDPVSPPEQPPKDTIQTTDLITKEKADTMIFEFLLGITDNDTSHVISTFGMTRVDNFFLKSDTIAVLKHYLKDSSMTIILEENSWVYYSGRIGVDCIGTEGYTILNTNTGKITPKIGGYECTQWLVEKDYKIRKFNNLDIFAEWRLLPKYSENYLMDEHIKEFYGDK